MSGLPVETAPILSTPDSHIFEDPTPTTTRLTSEKLSDEQLYITYEIKRTVEELRSGRWQRIALQFPDDMLSDAPRVFERLRDGLRSARTKENVHGAEGVKDLVKSTQETSLGSNDSSISEEKLTILADTSYGACCVDEIAAEHVDAEVVVHYGRSCLSPTARLPVIYVFTTRPLDHEAVISTFQKTYPNRDTKMLLLADIPYHGHIEALSSQLRAVGYVNLFAPSVTHDPSSPIPNRTVPTEALSDASLLREYSLFHIADPPTSLLLNVSSRVSSIYICSLASAASEPVHAIEASTAQMLRRRYALVTKLSTAPIFGILINTLSVKNYMSVLARVKEVISNAGKKYYTFVVGKVNAAKVANFSEVEGWVVIGCWESSLIESKEFWKPIITPYELELALTDERDRLWTGEWSSDFQALLNNSAATSTAAESGRPTTDSDLETDNEADDSEEESEPPVFDLRTGKYVSQSRPMSKSSRITASDGHKKTSTSLVKRVNGDLAQIGGQVSPAAEYLRSKRTWQGLGSDHEIAYQYDQEGAMQGASMEQGRAGIARGYAVGEDRQRT